MHKLLIFREVRIILDQEQVCEEILMRRKLQPKK